MTPLLSQREEPILLLQSHLPHTCFVAFAVLLFKWVRLVG